MSHPSLNKNLPFSHQLFFKFAPHYSIQTNEALEKISKFLPDTELIINRKVGLSQLSQSGMRHLIADGGMDPVIASFISGNVSRNYGAQGNYLNQSMYELNAAFETARIRNWDKLTAVNSSIAESIILYPLSKLEPAFDKFEFPLVFSLCNQNFSVEDYGSSLVPLPDELKIYFASIRKFAAEVSDPITAFNLKTAVAALQMHKNFPAKAYRIRKQSALVKS